MKKLLIRCHLESLLIFVNQFLQLPKSLLNTVKITHHRVEFRAGIYQTDTSSNPNSIDFNPKL